MMRCYACDDGLPTDNKNNLDPETGRFYCTGCGQEISTLYEEMYMKNPDGTPKKPEESLLDGEVETLDDDFDEVILNDIASICDIQTEDNWEDLSLPPENYDE